MSDHQFINNYLQDFIELLEPNDGTTEELVKFNFFQPHDAQLISASLGIGNDVLLRYLYKGNNVLVILDKNTMEKRAFITLKKDSNIW